MTMPLQRTGRERILLTVGAIGPLGRLPASGTVTVALVGVPLYRLTAHVPLPVYAGCLVAFALLSVKLHAVGDRLLGEKDSRTLVWDELVGYLIAVIGVGVFTWPIAVAAFFVERAIDIGKVPPANWIERRWPGGWGVVGDDVVAGLYTAMIIQSLVYLSPTWMGLPAL